jgi:hypothetical protein
MMISLVGSMEGFRITQFTILITVQEIDGSAAKNTLSGVTLTSLDTPYYYAT